MIGHHLPRRLARLGELQTAHPWLFVIAAIVSVLLPLYGIVGAGGLGFKADFAELLPEDKESVVEAARISKLLPGASTLTVVAEIEGGSNPDALRRFVDALVPRLQALGPSKVGGVEYGVQDTQAFFERNKLLFAPLPELRKAHDEIIERYDWEVAKATDGLLDDEAPPPITVETIENRVQTASTDFEAAKSKYPQGYFMDEAGTYAAVLIRTPVSGNAPKAELKQEVEAAVEATSATSFDPRMKVAYTGNFITGQEEYDAIISDLMHVGGWGVAGVLGSVLLFFMRFRTLVALGGTILVALIWTFGLTRLTIGYLNSSTGFLVSIIAGNGINYGIMYMARFIEARRDEKADVGQAVQLALRDTWIPTLAASATAMLAYGSLMLTDFRGFKHFGIISAYGMIFCWISTFLFVPAILVAAESVRPSFEAKRPGTWLRGQYGVGFAWLARAAPRTITVLGVLAGAVALYASARYLAGDPMEYNMKNVRNERKDETTAGALSHRVDKIVGRMGQDGMAIMVDRLDQVAPLQKELERRRDEAPADLKPFDEVVTIFSLLPKDQDEKIKLLETMRDRLERARKRGFLDDAQWAKLQPHIPAERMKPIAIADLPDTVARPFTERDGTRGRIVYISPATGFSVWDARYLMRWADSYRHTTLPNGEVVKGSGSAVIFADMIRAISEDAPKAILFSSIGATLVILAAFRFHRHAWGVFLPWLLGIAGLLAYLYFSGTKLNFLNFVTLPITIGIGAEYAHSLMQRYRREGPARIFHITKETGGAVVLCSMTTVIGYLALTLSINQGIRSFGMSAAVGEFLCVLAAVLVLPAVLFWRTAREQLAAAGAAPDAASPPGREGSSD